MLHSIVPLINNPTFTENTPRQSLTIHCLLLPTSTEAHLSNFSCDSMRSVIRFYPHCDEEAVDCT
jgi:hypothetical protein